MDIILVCAACAYLGFGTLIYFAMRGSVEFSGPKWLAPIIVISLWPLALFVLLWGFLSWIARGSH